MKNLLRSLTLFVVAMSIAIAWPQLTTEAQSTNVRVPLSSATCPGSGCVSLGVTGVGGVGVQITGTFSGTLAFEGSIDGVTYTSLNMTPVNGSTAVTSTTSTGIWNGGIGGLSVVRVRFSSYTSGTAVVTIQNAPTTARGGSGGGAATSPGGSDTQVQFNDAGSFGGSSGLTWSGTVLGLTGKLALATSAELRALDYNTNFHLNADGSLWIGTADNDTDPGSTLFGVLPPTGQLGVHQAATAVNNNYGGVVSAVYASPDGTTTGGENYWSGAFGVLDTDLAAEQSVESLTGLYVPAYGIGSLHTTTLRGAFYDVESWDGGTGFGGITNQIGVEIQVYTEASKQVFNAYGLFIDDMADNATVNNQNWAIRYANYWGVGAGGENFLSERSDPAAPVADGVYLYAKDNGAGKTQLCAKFNTGAVQCFATQP